MTSRHDSKNSTQRSSNSLEKQLSEFNSTRATVSKNTDNLLYPEHEDYEYRRIRNAVIYHGKLSKEDSSAIIIQKTFRMYRIRSFFLMFRKQFRHVKTVTERPYFVAFLLNSHATSANRKELYESQFSRTLFCHKVFKGYEHPPFHIFTITDQCLIPPSIDSNVLGQFVKTFYRSCINKIFQEWRFIARNQIFERKHKERSDFDVLSRKRFGNEYTCFHLWYRYTKTKKKKVLKHSAHVPQWDHYMKLVEKKQSIYRDALNIRQNNMKKLVVQALLNRVIEKREEQEVLQEADKFKLKRNMLFALSAWAHYIVLRHNRINTLRSIMRQWFGISQQSKHLSNAKSAFVARHAYFMKRAGFTAFVKNRRISQITSAYLYCRIQTKPSLALYFLALLHHEDDVAPFYLAMHIWASFTRRRKKWQQFLFNDIKTSDYDYSKKKALAALRKQRSPFPLIPVTLGSPQFQQDTLYLYEYVMKMKTENEEIFLLSSDEEARKEVSESTNSRQQREIFFKIWLKMKVEPSLMMRLAAINANHRRTINANEMLKPNDRIIIAYKKAVTFLESFKLASEDKFKILQKTIADNNKKALENRTKCLIRDKMIIYAHYSHYDAQQLKTFKPLFATNDKLLVVSKIKDASGNLMKSFSPLVSVSALGSVLEQPNTFSFSQLLGCKSRVAPFNVDINEIRQHYKNQMQRAKLSPITQIQFERLMAGASEDAGHKNLKAYQRVEPYAMPLIDPKPSVNTGVNRRLLESFPLKTRKPIQIGRTTSKKVNLNVINQQIEHEQEHEVEEEDGDPFEIITKKKITNPLSSYAQSKGSMFFGSMNSFSSLLTSSNLSAFGSTASLTSGLNVKLDLNSLGDFIQDNSGSSDSDNENSKLGKSILSKVLALPDNDDISDYNDNEDDDDISTYGQNTENTNSKMERKFTISRQVNEGVLQEDDQGFNDTVMKSVAEAKPPLSPKAQSKVKVFLEILFGKNPKEKVSIPIQNLKKRLMQELKNQKEGGAIPGLQMQTTVMPIASLVDTYHSEREKEMNRLEALAEEKKEKEKEKTVNLEEDNQNIQPAKPATKPIPAQTNDNQGNDKEEACTVTYRSVRYGTFAKKSKHHKGHSRHSLKSRSSIDSRSSKSSTESALSIDSKHSVLSKGSTKSKNRKDDSNDINDNDINADLMSDRNETASHHSEKHHHHRHHHSSSAQQSDLEYDHTELPAADEDNIIDGKSSSRSKRSTATNGSTKSNRKGTSKSNNRNDSRSSQRSTSSFSTQKSKASAESQESHKSRKPKVSDNEPESKESTKGRTRDIFQDATTTKSNPKANSKESQKANSRPNAKESQKKNSRSITKDSQKSKLRTVSKGNPKETLKTAGKGKTNNIVQSNTKGKKSNGKKNYTSNDQDQDDFDENNYSEYYDNNSYSYSYSYSYSASSSSSDLEDFYRDRTPAAEIPDSPSQAKRTTEEEEHNEEEEKLLNEADIDPTQSPRNGSNEELSTPRSHTSNKSNSSIKSGQNKIAPFSALDEAKAKEDALAHVNKLVFQYIKKGLEEEEELDLVDIDDDEIDEINSTEESKLKEKKRAWKQPKYTPSFKKGPTPLLKKNNNKLSSSIRKTDAPIVIPQKSEVTPSMKSVMKEDNQVTRLLYTNGKTLIRPGKKLSNSYHNRKKIFNLFNQQEKLHTPSLNSYHLDNGDNQSQLSEEQVVSFSGGGRGLSTDALNMQKLRVSRSRQIMATMEKDEPIVIPNVVENKVRKAKEYEDLGNDYANMRSVLTQLIQMLASSQDDSYEFERLRKRAKFLRKKPSFVGIFKLEQNSPEAFFRKLQGIYIRYSRKKDSRAASDELLELIQENIQFAPIIINVIEKTVMDERRFLDSKLQKDRLGKQATEGGMTVHYLDLDWMTSIPDYKAVALQYKDGYDNPSNLDALVAPIRKKENNRFKSKGQRGKRDISKYNFIMPNKTNWDRTLEKFELTDLMMISSLVPEELMDEVINDHIHNHQNIDYETGETPEE